MPQFDFTHVFWPQLAWLAVIFAALYFGVILPTLPKIGKVVDRRETKVSGDILAAEAAKNGADALGEQTDGGLTAAHVEGRAVVAAAQAKAIKAVEKKLALADAKIDAQIESAQLDLEKARKKALGSVESIATDAASDIVEKLTGKRPSPSSAGKAAKAALALN
ncbi:MAG: hypothetical protein RIS52_2456 [Pseudomonadota bacterium]|jgi:F-type H+-transporting ATPase subunit b